MKQVYVSFDNMNGKVMKKVYHISTINEYNEIATKPTLHPLVSFIDFSTIRPSKRYIVGMLFPEKLTYSEGDVEPQK